MQTIVDESPEFNQTREHDHRPGATCFCGINGVVEKVIEGVVRDDIARAVPEVCKSAKSLFRTVEGEMAKKYGDQVRAERVGTPYDETTLAAMRPDQMRTVIRNLDTELGLLKEAYTILKEENNSLSAVADDTDCDLVDVLLANENLKTRIAGFERILGSFAALIDSTRNADGIITAETKKQGVACGQPSPTRSDTACAMPAGHDGPCVPLPIAA